ncbi:hypothetical protein JCM6882_000861 [Rhodosporidiobolus microsporus]
MATSSHEASALLHDIEAPLSIRSPRGHHADHEYHPKTVQRIVTRIQALTLELLPIQCELEELTSPTSSILNKDVVDAYAAIAGDFSACLPFALLEARRYFRRQQQINPSDADENAGRKLACEAIARKLVARAEMREQYSLLSKRWTTVDEDGDETLPLSALESAVDQHATFFLSSNEAQRCTFALWKGTLVQKLTANNNVQYEPYKANHGENVGFLARWNPDRVGVPRYQFFFRIGLWVLFLACYTLAIQTPERGFGFEDWVLYVQLLGYAVEDFVKIYKIGWRASVGFWALVNYAIYTMAGIAFVYRILDITTHDDHKSAMYRMRAFQWLSSAAPLIWAKLLTVFDLFRFFGVLQIVIFRMLKESAVFLVLLSVLAMGFGQALTGLDVADEKRDSTNAVVNTLLQALLGSPNFDFYDVGASSYPFGLVLYYSWSVATIVILLNVLVALFSTSYSECVDESEPTFLSFFAGKTISSVRAPDQYIYPAPFNLIECLIIPLEFVLSKEAYGKINRVLMGFLFFIPISCIALWETHVDPLSVRDLDALIAEQDDYQEPEEDPEPYRTGDGDSGEFDHPGEPEGMEISKVKFKDLKERMPDLTRSVEGKTLALVLELSKEIKALREEVAALRAGQPAEADKNGKKAAKQASRVKDEAQDAADLAD